MSVPCGMFLFLYVSKNKHYSRSLILCNGIIFSDNKALQKSLQIVDFFKLCYRNLRFRRFCDIFFDESPVLFQYVLLLCTSVQLLLYFHTNYRKYTKSSHVNTFSPNSVMYFFKTMEKVDLIFGIFTKQDDHLKSRID